MSGSSRLLFDPYRMDLVSITMDSIQRPVSCLCRLLRNLWNTVALCLVIFVVFALFLGRSVLVLLVFRDKVIHVGFSFGELHLIHAFTGVPMKESFAAEHGSELLRDALEHLLNSCGVANEGGRHLQTLGGNVTDR